MPGQVVRRRAFESLCSVFLLILWQGCCRLCLKDHYLTHCAVLRARCIIAVNFDILVWAVSVALLCRQEKAELC